VLEIRENPARKGCRVALMLAAQMAGADGAAADVRPHLAQDFAANLL
jgi:hypothetical protein